MIFIRIAIKLMCFLMTNGKIGSSVKKELKKSLISIPIQIFKIDNLFTLIK